MSGGRRALILPRIDGHPDPLELEGECIEQALGILQTGAACTLIQLLADAHHRHGAYLQTPCFQGMRFARYRLRGVRG